MDEDPRTFVKGEKESNPYYKNQEAPKKDFVNVKRWIFDKYSL